MTLTDVVDDLAAAKIGATYNFYRDGDGSELRRARLRAYLNAHDDAAFVLVAEAPGYRGTRVSGVPLTSERQLSGTGPAEATATVVHRTLEELGLAGDVLLWNVVPTHPHVRDRPHTNRRPTRAEVEAARPFLDRLVDGRRIVAVGRSAEAALSVPRNGLLLGSVRHPSHGGAAAFEAGLRRIVRAETT